MKPVVAICMHINNSEATHCVVIHRLNFDKPSAVSTSFTNKHSLV